MGQYIGGSVCVLQGYKPCLLKVPTITHVSYAVGCGNTAKEWAAIKQEDDEEEMPTSNNIPTPTPR